MTWRAAGGYLRRSLAQDGILPGSSEVHEGDDDSLGPEGVDGGPAGDGGLAGAVPMWCRGAATGCSDCDMPGAEQLL